MGKLTGVNCCVHMTFFSSLANLFTVTVVVLRDIPTWEGVMNIHTHITTCIIGRDKEVALFALSFFNLCEYVAMIGFTDLAMTIIYR